MKTNAFHNMKRHSTMRKAQSNLVYVALQKAFGFLRKVEGYAPIGGRGERGDEKGTHPHKILIQTFQHLSTHCKPFHH